MNAEPSSSHATIPAVERRSSFVAQFLKSPRAMLLGDGWFPASSGRLADVFNPATGEVLARSAAGDRQDVDRAVQAARAAFDDGSWSGAAEARAHMLWKTADLIEAHADELAELECLNNGMPLRDARSFFVVQAARCFRHYAGCADKLYGRAAQVCAGPASYHAYTLLEPVGVVALIVPWNVPLLMASWKVAPALAAGCTCVLKPSKETPLTALRLGELMLEAGLPPGVLNIVLGSGSDVGSPLAAHPDVDKVSFTGSTEVGRSIGESALGNLKKVSLELGGKSPVIVFDDADLDQAIAGASHTIFVNAGQTCVAGSRLYVQKKSYDRVVSGIAAVAANMRLGNGLLPETEMGPVISAKQREHILHLIESGIQQGAELVTGGKSWGDRGYFVAPTVLGRANASMRVVQEEIFGPVLTATPFTDPDEVVHLANDTPYGLAGSVWTRDISRGHLIAKKIRAGVVGINCHGLFDYSVPHGGYKQSGWGRELGEEGLLEYLETKSVFAQL
jgi:phenylacetaldehyde dehydrogenase